MHEAPKHETLTVELHLGKTITVNGMDVTLLKITRRGWKLQFAAPRLKTVNLPPDTGCRLDFPIN